MQQQQPPAQFRPVLTAPIPMGALQPQFSALAAQGAMATPGVALPSQPYIPVSVTPNIATLTSNIQNSRITSGAGTATFSMQPSAMQPQMFTTVPAVSVANVAAAQPPMSFVQRLPMTQPQVPQAVAASAQRPPPIAMPMHNPALASVAALPTIPLLPVTPQVTTTATTPHAPPPPNSAPPPTTRGPPHLTRYDATPIEPTTIEPTDMRSQTPLSPTGGEATAAVPLTLDEQLTANHKALANSTRNELQILLARRGVDFRALSHALAGDAKLDANALVTTTVPPRACTSEMFWWSASLPTANGTDSLNSSAKKRARTDAAAAAASAPPTSRRRTVPAAFQEALLWLRETGVTVEVNNQSHRIFVHSEDACVTRGGWRVLLTPRFANSELPLPAFAMDVVTIVADATPESFRISLALSDDGARVEALQHALQRLSQRAVQRDLRDVTSLAREWCTILLDPEPHAAVVAQQ